MTIRVKFCDALDQFKKKPLTCRLRYIGLVLWFGCSSTVPLGPSTVLLTYTPEQNVRRVKGAGGVTVAVNDLRANPNKVGSVTGTAPKAGNLTISTTTNVAEVIRIAVEAELRDRGFAVGSGLANVAIDVSQFDVQRVVTVILFNEHDYKSHAQVLLHVEVTGAGHERTYERLVFGQGDSENGSEQTTLDLALQRAIQSLFADPKFTRAILEADSANPVARK